MEPITSPRFGIDERPEVLQLLANVAASLPALEALLDRCSGHWGYEDPIYRFGSVPLSLQPQVAADRRGDVVDDLQRRCDLLRRH